MNLKEKIKSIVTYDKIGHFLIGCSCAMAGLFIAELTDMSFIIFSLVFTTVAAVGKELYDYYEKETKFDLYDILFTYLGAFLIIGIILF